MKPPQKSGTAAAAVGSGSSPACGSLGAFLEWTGCMTSWNLPDMPRNLVTYEFWAVFHGSTLIYSDNSCLCTL